MKLSELTISPKELANKINQYKDNTRAGKRIILYELNDCYYCSSHCVNSDGYVSIYIEGKYEGLHRFVYYLLNPEADKNLLVRHTCNNAGCCKPEHLKAGTTQDNSWDMVLSNRQSGPNSTNHHNAQLTRDQVLYIRGRPRQTATKLAKELGVSLNIVRGVRLGNTYKDITNET